MIDHTGVAVSDFEKSKAWYSAALRPIGYQLMMEFAGKKPGDRSAAGFGEPPNPDFWIGEAKSVSFSTHVAFRVKKRSLVDAFYKAALQAGGRDNGAPGIRAHYHPTYYGAFVYDLDGHNIEVVCHEAE